VCLDGANNGTVGNLDFRIVARTGQARVKIDFTYLIIMKKLANGHGSVKELE
jgi:hypothetical protein